MLETINLSKLRTEFGSAPISEKVAAGENARRPDIPRTIPLNAVRLPAVALDRLGLVVDVNTAAEAIFDDDIMINDRRLFVRDTEAQAVLAAAIDNLKAS